jgi:hypothetical protein
MILPALALFAMSAPAVSEAATIRVPADARTIQQAIDVAAPGDIVLVSPGTYFERINFRGKSITVSSEQGPDVTIIDGQRGGIVVSFLSREGRDSVLTGFTIRGGYSQFSGAGVAITFSSPTIRGNTITQNGGCSGVGITIGGGAPRIENNRIVGNLIDACTGGSGIGIHILGNNGTPPEIVGNDISDNTSIGSTFGGGIGLNGAGAVLIQGNVIARNITAGAYGCGWGGGIWSANFGQATIVGNLIVGNVACFGGGANWGGTTGTTTWVNNTIAGNSALYQPALVVVGFSFNRLYNNILSAASGPAFYCDFAPAQGQVLVNNDVFSDGAAPYGGNCADQTGLNGNISSDPRFIDPDHGDYRLTMTSPAIDAGFDAAPLLPAVDLSGSARVVDGNGDGSAHVDLGAFEYHNHAPAVSAGDDQTVALSGGCTADVTLNATGSDPDGDALTYVWTSALGTQTGQTLSLALPAGTYRFTVTANDGNGGLASDTVVVSVVDDTPPVISAISATPRVITANDHKMVPIVVSVSVSDQCVNAVSCRIVDVSSNESVDGLGDGDTSPDWEITGPLTLNVRAERSGNGTGRVYIITVVCTDPSGNPSSTVVTVTVSR